MTIFYNVILARYYTMKQSRQFQKSNSNLVYDKERMNQTINYIRTNGYPFRKKGMKLDSYTVCRTNHGYIKYLNIKKLSEESLR